MHYSLERLLSDRHHLGENTNSQDVFARAHEFSKIIDSLKQMQAYPYFQALECNFGTEAIFQGKRVLMLGSNNYLGLTTHPRVREAAVNAINQYGPSATGSRLLNGTLEIHHQFEDELAQFFGKEAALVFTTGYQVNLGIITALANENTNVFLDKLNHASLHDAVNMTECHKTLFKHNSAEDLELQLKNSNPALARLIAVDGVFSMEGDICPLPQIVELAKKYNARLMVDDAHALGVLGPKGNGTAAHFNLNDQVDLIMTTFSKSLASTGGCVAGSKEVVEYIKYFGRSIVFSASLTPPNLASAREALKILIEEPQLVTQVQSNSKYLRESLAQMGWHVGGEGTPIIPVHIGNDLATMLIWKELLDAGVYVNPILYPAVAKDRALLRVSTIATHSQEQLNQALYAFEKVGKQNGMLEKVASGDA